MKGSFQNVAPEKRQRIIDAAIHEFGRHGYESGSLDKIVLRAGISKGGLYEYIESKQDLFLFLAEYSYDSLYTYIKEQLAPGTGLPPDIIDRIALVSRVAVDFYVKHPHIISFITKTSDINDVRLKQRVQGVFKNHFDELFGDSDWSDVAFDREKVLGLLKWLLVRTRNSFLRSLTVLRNKNLSKTAYLEDWDFHLRILRKGIYTAEDT